MTRFARFLLCLVLGVSLGFASPHKVAAQGRIGVNPSSVVDFYGDLTFADAHKHRRPYYVHSTSTEAPVDANGWASTDFDCSIATVPTGLTKRPELVSGRYAIRFTGIGGVAGSRYTPCSIVSSAYDLATNTTTILADFGPDPNSDIVALYFHDTQRDSTAAKNTGITNLQIMRPIAAGSTTPHNFDEVFSRQFLAALAPFKVLRTLDLNQTNSASPSNSTTWGQRRLPGDANQSVYGTDRGIAYEYQVALANSVGADLWVPLSIYLDDDHATRFFRLCCFGSDGLNPYDGPQPNPIYPPLTGKLLFTFGNEHWNYGFSNSGANRDLASAEFAAGQFDYSDNAYIRAQQRAARNTIRLRDLAAQVWGEEGFGTRFLPIYESQQGGQDNVNFGMLGYGLDYIKGHDARPINRILYGAGVSWYHSCDPLYAVMKAGGSAYPTPDQVFASQPPSSFPAVAECAKFVASYGLQFVAYEGGEVFELDNNNHSTDAQAAIATVQSDPRFAPFVRTTIDQTAPVAAYACLYGLGQTPWQLARSTNDLTEVKYTATVAALAALAGPPVSAAIPPATLNDLDQAQLAAQVLATADAAAVVQVQADLVAAQSKAAQSAAAAAGCKAELGAALRALGRSLVRNPTGSAPVVVTPTETSILETPAVTGATVAPIIPK